MLPFAKEGNVEGGGMFVGLGTMLHCGCIQSELALEHLNGDRFLQSSGFINSKAREGDLVVDRSGDK